MNINSEITQDLPISIIVEKSVDKALSVALVEVNTKLDKLQTLLSKVIGEKTYSVKEIASLTGRNYDTVRRHARNGTLSAAKKGKNYMITQEELEDYLTDNIRNEER